MTPASPLQTVWPVGVVGLVWLWLCWRHRAAVRLTPTMLALAAVAFIVRLWWIPALGMHAYDGHEAEYWDLYRGMRAPTRGGTVMIPGMQWLWWLLGQVLPAWPKVPVVLMSAVGVASIGLVGGTIGLLGGRLAGIVAALVLIVSPAHAAWSSSAYNVILPFFFCSMATFSAAWSTRQPTVPLAMKLWVGTSLVLAVALRMDTGMVALLVVWWVLAEGRSGLTVLARLRAWVPAGGISVGLAAACIWPMIWPGGLPGDGERSVAIFNNITFLDVYGPFGGEPGLAVLLLAGIIVARERLALALSLVTFVIAHHLMMVTFDDFGERHALVALPGFAGLLGLAARHRLGQAAALAALGLSVLGVVDMSERYYGSEESFAALLEEGSYASLPRVDIAEVPPSECGWVAEDARVAADPVASHFNILRPEEATRLRGSDGCLRWCVDVQDWRWSSRGIRDRAQRLSHIYGLSPLHVVTDPDTGYACLVMDVGQRTVPIPGSKFEDHTAASRRDHPVP